MNPIQYSIGKPIAVAAAVLLVVILGFISFERIPIQLVPDLNKPVVSITTVWPGAAPEEIEREIINRQEDVLRGIDGVQEMRSSSRPNTGSVDLEFRSEHREVVH